MTISSELAEILSLRLSPAYQAAELIRHQIGAAAMAAYPTTSEQYGGVRLMIGTWETIAIRVRTNDPLKVPFYQTNPVGYMWKKLYPAIKIIRTGFRKRGRDLYARQFFLINRAYMIWLNEQSPIYQTAALAGINAQFG